jgi:hypothetical protein
VPIHYSGKQIVIICHHLQGLLFKLLRIGLAKDENSTSSTRSMP